jgi:ABC-type Fe3+/spermidine/putrescine transport system ATPase subunit
MLIAAASRLPAIGGVPVTQPDAAPLVRLRGVTKSYGGLVAVRPLDLEIRSGDFLAIVGPSGCGKTTLLNMIAGFIAPDAGRIEIAGADVTRLGPERRPTNMVFQSYGLFPHMTVRQNIAYGLRIAKVPADEIRRRVEAMVDLVHLEGLEDRSVQHLSGGQAQRVALSRALVMRPKVLLLDEPLAALDLQLRKAMQEELRRIHHSIGGTFVFVTHDQEEAMRLANRIAVMQAGRLIQDGSAEEIYAHPRTLFVSTFIGEANIFRGRRRDGRVELEIGVEFASPGPDGRLAAVVRPQAMAVAGRGRALPGGCGFRLAGRIEDVVFLGTNLVYKVSVGATWVTVQTPDVARSGDLAIGSEVEVGWSAAAQTLLPEEP